MKDEPLQAGERLHGERLRRAIDRHRAMKAKQAEILKEFEQKKVALPHSPPAPLVSSVSPAKPLPYHNSYGSFFGPSQKVVPDRVMERARGERNRKASGSLLTQKQARVSDKDSKVKIEPKTGTKLEPARKKPKFSRTECSFLQNDEDPTGESPRATSKHAKQAKQRSFQTKETKFGISRGANVKERDTPIQIVKRTHSTLKETLPTQVLTRKDLSTRVVPTTLATTRKETSSNTQNVKEKIENKKLSSTRKVSSSKIQNVKDKKENKKLYPTLEGKADSTQSNHPNKKSIDNAINELEDLEDLITTHHATMKNNSNRRRRKLIVSVSDDDDDDLEDSKDIPTIVHATMGFNAKTYIRRDDEDASNMEANFETIAEEERISKRER